MAEDEAEEAEMIELATILAQRGNDVEVDLTLPGIVALVAGILILFIPRLLNYIVAGYLIVVGLISVFDLKI